MNLIRKLQLYIIQCIIIGLSLLCNYPASAVNKERVHNMVNGGHIIGNLQEENGNNTTRDVPCTDCSYTAFIIAIAAFIIILFPTAAGWYLYYRLRKKTTTYDEERAIEDPQPKTFTSNCFIKMFRLLYDRVKRRKTIYDEENVIEKSPTKPTTSKSTPRNKDTKKKRKKKKASMKKSIGEAAEISSGKPNIDVQFGLSPQTPALPKENVCIANVIEPEQPCMVPFIDLSREQESVPLDPVSKTKYKRIIILTWIDEITDDEDDEGSTQVKESQEQITMDLTSIMPEAPAKEVLPIIIKSSPEQIFECQQESPVLPQPNLSQAIEPEEKQLPETDRNIVMDQLADRSQAIEPEEKQLPETDRNIVMDQLADRRQAIEPEEKRLPDLKTHGHNLMDRLCDCCNKSKSIASYLKKICPLKKLIHKRKRPKQRRVVVAQEEQKEQKEQKEEFQERQIVYRKPNMIALMLRHNFKDLTDKLPIDIWRYILTPPVKKPQKKKKRSMPPKSKYVIDLEKHYKETATKVECEILTTVGKDSEDPDIEEYERKLEEEWMDCPEEWKDPINEQFAHCEPSTSQAIEPEEKQLPETDRDNVMGQLADRRQAIKPEEKRLPDLKTHGHNLMDRLCDCCNKSKSIASYLKKICPLKKLIHKRKRPKQRRVVVAQEEQKEQKEQKEEFQERQIVYHKPNMIALMLRHHFKEFTDKLPIDIWRYILTPPVKKPQKKKKRSMPPKSKYVIDLEKHYKETATKVECEILTTVGKDSEDADIEEYERKLEEEWMDCPEEWKDPMEERFAHCEPSTSQKGAHGLTPDILRKIAQDCADKVNKKQKKEED